MTINVKALEAIKSHLELEVDHKVAIDAVINAINEQRSLEIIIRNLRVDKEKALSASHEAQIKAEIDTANVINTEVAKQISIRGKTEKAQSDLDKILQSLESFRIRADIEIKAKENLIMQKREEFNTVSIDLNHIISERDAFLTKIRS